MLNLPCIQLLADRKRISDSAVRFFLRLICFYDLRTWKAIDIAELIKLSTWVDRPHCFCRRSVAVLLKTGCLEIGRPLAGIPTFRIAPRYLLQGRDLEDWLLDIETRKQREALVPPEKPVATLVVQ